VRARPEEIRRLKKELAVVRAERDAAVAEAAELRKLYENLCHEYSKLRRKVVGPSREHVPSSEAQHSLFEVLRKLGLVEKETEAEAEKSQDELDALRRGLEEGSRRTQKKRMARPHGRRDLTGVDLPVERIVLEPPERLMKGGERLEKIGEEVAEVIERRPATLVRVQVVRPKYKKPGSPLLRVVRDDDEAPPDTAIVVASPLERPLPRGMAGPGLLAYVLVSKYADHIPLNRMATMFLREGVGLSRSTLCDWVRGCATLLKCIVEAMWADARETAPLVLTDATGVLVRQKERCRRVALYVLVVPGEHVLFGAVARNDGESVAALLAGFGGRPVIMDASAVYHELLRREQRAGRPILEVGCWSHARRGLFDALPTDRERALTAIGFISLLYQAHRESTDAQGRTDGARRKRLAAPVLKKLYAYVESERPRLVKGTPIDEAFGYLVNQKKPLHRFLDDGRLRLDNNPSELELRAEVVGQNNWLFCGSDGGVEWNTTLVSLIASCRLHGIEPWAYLRDVLSLLPGWKKDRVLELAPKYWKATRARKATQRRLEELKLLGRPAPPGAKSAA